MPENHIGMRKVSTWNDPVISPLNSPSVLEKGQRYFYFSSAHFSFHTPDSLLFFYLGAQQGDARQ